MGARPSSFKGGGGRLNGVDAKITGYRWTDEFLGHAFEEGTFKGRDGKKVEKPHNLYLEVSFLVDGAEKEIAEPLRVSKNFDAFDISEDGLTLTNAEGGPCSPNKNTAAAKFMASLVEPEVGPGFPEERLSDDDDSVNYEPIIGTRVRLTKVENKDAAEFDKNNGGTGKRKGKDGKEYNFETLLVAQVYEVPDEDGGKKGSKKTAGKKTVKDDDDEASEETPTSLATTFIIKVVKAAGGKLAKPKVSMLLLKPENGLFKHPEREAIRKLLNSDKFLNTEDGWSYDEDKELITVKGGK